MYCTLANGQFYIQEYKDMTNVSIHYSGRLEEAVTLQNRITNILSLADVLKSICNDKSLSIFQLIATVHCNGEIILKKLGVTRKQYYSKISAMMKAGLIKRQNGKYYLTPFGKVIYYCTTIAKNALDNYYNLKAIEAIEVSGLLNEEIGKIVDVLIDNPQVKEFVTKKC